MGTNLYQDLPYMIGTGGCECCKPRMVSSTFTVNTHKWTQKEIEERILEIAEELANASWWDGNRGSLRYELKHWTEKLKRFKEAKEDFK